MGWKTVERFMLYIRYYHYFDRTIRITPINPPEIIPNKK